MRTARDWGQPCPNPKCSHHNLMNRGNISSIATYLTQSGKRRIFRCGVCQRSFSETRDTVFFDLRTPEEKVMLALKMLLVRVDLSGICPSTSSGTTLCWASPKRRCWSGSNGQRRRPRRSIDTCCVNCRSRKCNSTRCGTSSNANRPGRAPLMEKACRKAKMDGNGSG